MPVPPFAPELEVPPELEAVVQRLLEKQPAKRFESARDAAQALEAIDVA
jgi:hypothetical protein